MLYEIFDDGKFLGFEDAPHEEAAIVAFANKRQSRADPFTTLAEVRQDQGFPHREVTAVAAYATMPPAAPASADDQASFASAFELFCRLDEAKATAARLRAAAGRTTGSEWRENIEGVGVAEAEATRIEAELEALKASHQGQDAEPRADEAQPVAAPLSLHAHQEDAEPTKPKRETQADRIARWVGECERRAADAGEPLDRRRMPGKKAEFLDLLHALDAELRSIKTVESLDRYLAGCKWAGGRQPSAAPLFARLFPEARIRVTGAVSVQRRKA